MLRKLLKKNKKIVTFYQKYFLPSKPAKAEEQWVRIIMDQETERLVKQLNPKKLNALEISGKKWKKMPFRSYKSYFFPEFDICSTTLNESFDIIIAEQVFEHLFYPYRAGKNVYEMLSESGVFLITTPFLLKYHPDPIDCSRWTAEGLKYFLNECGFDLDKIEVYSWGNRDCLISNLNQWTKFNPKKHSLKNEEDFPLVVWAIAKK